MANVTLVFTDAVDGPLDGTVQMTLHADPPIDLEIPEALTPAQAAAIHAAVRFMENLTELTNFSTTTPE